MLGRSRIHKVIIIYLVHNLLSTHTNPLVSTDMLAHDATREFWTVVTFVYLVAVVGRMVYCAIFVREARPVPIHTELPLDVNELGLVCQHLSLADLGRLACAVSFTDDQPILDRQDSFMLRPAQHWMAGRRLVDMGIWDTDVVPDIWANGAWVVDGKWRLMLHGFIEGDDAESLAMSMAKLAREGGTARTIADDALYCYRPRVQLGDAWTRSINSSGWTQAWCELEHTVTELLDAPSDIERLGMADAAVFKLLSSWDASDDMREMYIPQARAAFQRTAETRALFDKLFRRVRDYETPRWLRGL